MMIVSSNSLTISNVNDGNNGLAGKDGVGIYATKVEYVGSTSGTSKPTSGWLTTVPNVAAGSFLWTKTTWSYTDGTSESGYSVAKMGEKGDAGKDGIAGKDGKGIKSTTVTYQASLNGTTAPIGAWTANVPNTSKGQYLWTRTVWTYTDNITETGYSVSYIAKDGNDGTNGVAGKDGVGIKSTTITYASSASGTTAPTTGWTANPPATSAGQFIWTKTVWSYTDGTNETGYSVGKIGEKGDQGIKGPAGMDGKTSYTHIAYANSATGEGFSEQPGGKTYIGMYVDFTATDSTDITKYNWSLVKGTDGANGTPGKAGADGKTPYLHVAYSNSADGATGFTIDNPDGKKFAYLGTYTDYTQADPTDPTKYLWSLIKGEAGANGKDGQDAYLHIAYANSVDGKTNFTTDQSQAHNRDYLGTYSDNTKAQSTDPTKYTWQLTRGVQGLQGQPGSKDVPVVTMSSTAPSNPKNGDFWYQTTTDASGQKITGFSVYSGGKWVPSKIDQSTLVLTKLVSVEIDSATINSPDITVPFDFFDESQNEYKGTMEFKDGMLKHISTMPDGGILKTIISPMGYTLDAYDNQSKYTQNNPYVHSEMLADNIGFYNTNTKKSGILGASGIRGTLNGNTDSSIGINMSWEDVHKYLPEMSRNGYKRDYDWFDMTSSVQSHPNLLKNASLIDGFSYWNPGPFYRYAWVHDGNVVAHVGGTNSLQLMGQTVTNIIANANIVFSFWFYMEGSLPGDAGVIIAMQDSNSNVITNVSYKIDTKLFKQTETWYFNSINPITIPSNADRLVFYLYNNSTTSMHFSQPMLNYGDQIWPYQPT